MVIFGKRFSFGDLVQQIVGGFLLAGPFVVTEEVWSLARAMNRIQAGLTVVLVLLIGYSTLFEADEDRNEERERRFLGVPYRFISLIVVSYLSVVGLALLLSAPTTFNAGFETTLKAISIGAIFSVVGAASADSIF
ncbi:MAG: DUF2391 family protein [bacterium]